MKLTKIIALAATAALLLCVLCGCGAEDTVKVEMDIENYGTVTLELDRSEAPITVDHFVKLVKDGSYDGSSFIRMQPGFVLQGGANAKDNSTIKGEFSSNGVQNNIQHKKGVISMARSTSPDSASSQFFIVLDDRAQSSLDGSYAGFGKVIAGWDVIEKICSDVTADMVTPDYYGLSMGFLQEQYYITVTNMKVVE